MATPKQIVLVGKGPIALGEFDAVNGVAGEAYLVRQKLVGCAHRKLSIGQSREKGELKEDCSGNGGVIATWGKGQKVDLTLELGQFSREELALGLYGQSLSRAAGTVTDELLRAGIAVGELFHLKHPKASSVVLKDSAGSPATLVDGTDYKMQSLPHSRGIILNLGSYTLPFKASYSYDAYSQITAFTAASTQRGLIFDGINISDGNSPVRAMIARIDFDPTVSFDWIGDDNTTLVLTGQALYTDELADNSDFGAYYKVDALPADV